MSDETTDEDIDRATLRQWLVSKAHHFAAWRWLCPTCRRMRKEV